MIEIVAFESERRHVEPFVRLAHDLYRGDRRWLPPFRAEMLRDLSSAHPFRPFLEQRNFLATRHGRPVARVSAFVNNRVTLEDGPLGTLGHFESVDDPAIAEALIDRACTWLRDRGVRTVWGPMNGSVWMSYRFMTGGFEDMPFQGEPYNRPSYPGLFEAAGFEVLKRWQSTFSEGEELRGMVEKTRPRFERALGEGYRFRPLELSRFEDEMATLHRLISDSFAGFLGFHPIEVSTFLELFGGLRALCVPDLIQFALDPDGAIVGYVCSLPDHPRALRALGGETHPLARLRFLLSRGRPAQHVTIYLGLVEAEQRRRSGLGGALAHLTTRSAHEAGVPLVSALMAEDSLARSYSHQRTNRVHTYALYSRSLA